MEENNEFEVEKEYSVKETVAKLRRLADCLENGEAFEIQLDGNKIHMPVDVEMSIEYDSEGEEHELEFKFVWES